MSDESAQTKQVQEHAQHLRTTLDSIRATGRADETKIRLAQASLENVVRYAREAINGNAR